MAVATYYLCLIGILPAASWALWIGLIMLLAGQQNLGGVFRLAWRAFCGIGSWYFPFLLLLIVGGLILWLAAGLSPATRGYGYLATATLGFATLAYLVIVMPRQEPLTYLLLLPSLTAATASAVTGVKSLL